MLLTPHGVWGIMEGINDPLKTYQPFGAKEKDYE
jgi:hypothetical protein